MKKIVFISHYPIGDELKDGMSQRIKMIDTELSNEKRVYICINKRRYFKRQEYRDGQVEVYNLNAFLHRKIIRTLLKDADAIYCHSLYNLAYLFRISTGETRIFLDFHGSVPEELLFMGKSFHSKIYQWIERKMLPRVNYGIVVSYAMKQFYVDKYPNLHIKWIIKPIMPTNSIGKTSAELSERLLNDLRIKPSDTVFLYSGNLQKWQNFNMLHHIIRNDSDSSHVYLILTGQPLDAQKILNDVGNKRLFVKSIRPEELPNYYAIAHYGFLLREETILNIVAAPTKLFEYLFFGIRPIMLTTKVGDFQTYDCDYVSVTDGIAHLSPYKSARNVKIAKEIMACVEATKISDFI